MSNYNKEKSQIKIIAGFLDKLNEPYDYYDLDYGNGVIKPVLILTTEYNGINFDVIASAQSAKGFEKDWLTIRCFIYDFSKLKINKANELFKLCLELNYIIPETTFSVFQNRLFLEADMPLDINMDKFDFELAGFDIGLQNLFLRIKDIGVKIDHTKGLSKK